MNRGSFTTAASCDPRWPTPGIPNGPLLKWEGGKWVGDVPDGPWPPMSDKEKGKLPFIMKPDGVAFLFGPGLVDGPFPEHVRTLREPARDEPHVSAGDQSRVQDLQERHGQGGFGRPELSHYVCSTNGITEHWCSGSLTRWQPWLLEAQPELFVEISPQLAGELGIKNGDRVKVESIRGEVECVAMVTPRIRPFKIAGKTMHQVAMPYSFGWLMPKSDKNPTTNLLTPGVGDANTMCPEYKAFMVNVKKV